MRLSLIYKISIPVVFLFLAGVCGVLFLNYKQLKETIVASKINALMPVISAKTFLYKDKLIGLNPEEESFIKTATDLRQDIQDPSIINFAIWNREGKAVFSEQSKKNAFLDAEDAADIEEVFSGGQATWHLEKEEASIGEVLTLFMPLSFSGETPYVTELQFALSSDMEKMRDSLLNFALILLFAVLLAAIFLIASVYLMIIDPLKKMTEYLAMASEGKYDVKYDSRRKDEIGVLGFHFNQMISKIKVNQDALKKINLSLSDEVKKRTEDLEKQLSELQKWQELTTGREFRMIELKKELKKLQDSESSNQNDASDVRPWKNS